MKRLFVLAAALLISGCAVKTYDQAERDHSENNTNMFRSICLNNVKYWYRTSGHRGFLAVEINPETLKPMNCK